MTTSSDASTHDGDAQVPRDPRGLAALLAALEERGFYGQLTAVAGGAVRCGACGSDTAADALQVTALRRTEGASDPSDMLAVLAATCSSCATKGTAVLNYGPEATLEQAEVLRRLEDRSERQV